jgi:hypothetical protein
LLTDAGKKLVKQWASDVMATVGEDPRASAAASSSSCAAPPKEVDGFVANEELAELLEEMATTDLVNTGVVKAYKDDLAKKVVAKLHRARTWERTQAALERKARAARKVSTTPRKCRCAALLRLGHK